MQRGGSGYQGYVRWALLSLMSISLLAAWPHQSMSQSDGNQGQLELVSNEKFRDWRYVCVRATAQSALDCFARTSTHTTTEGGERKELAVVIVRKAVGDRPPVMSVLVARAFEGRDDIYLRIDDSGRYRLPAPECNERLCQIQISLPGEFVAALKRGLEMRVFLPVEGGEDAAVPTSLLGFTSAFARLNEG